MKQTVSGTIRRALSLTLALAVTLSLPLSARAEAIAPAYDETYYATLDYYGALQESSVVKTYRTFGTGSITDYGSYDEVINLTDGRLPTLQDGSVTFELGKDVPEYFYFEGKTAQPYEDFPWNLSLSYRLNGVPTPAEELAGRNGLIEIVLDVFPNPAASDYSRNNLVLTALSIFNADDILSLEAPGAQVQLVGNLRAVLYAVLPGEEQHFTIRVGSEDFSYSGMILLAVPATLAQLDQVSELKEAKEKTEASYDAINASLDVILNTLDGMSGSLNATARGLDELNAARSVISDGKGAVYESADAALGDLTALNEALEPLNGHLDTASQALTDIMDRLGALADSAVALKVHLAACRELLKRLQTDTENLRELCTQMESYNGDARKILGNLEKDFDDMSETLGDLSTDLTSLRWAVKGLGGVSRLPGLSVNGMSPAQLQSALTKARQAYQMYQAAVPPDQQDTYPFETFLTERAGVSPEEAGQLLALLEMSQDPEFQSNLKLLQTLDQMGLVDMVNKKIDEVNALITNLALPSAVVLEDLGDLTDDLGGGGLSARLQKLSQLCASLLQDIEGHNGELSVLLGHVDDLGELTSDVTERLDTTLDCVKTLDDTLQGYVPDVQQALTDAKMLADAATTGITDTRDFLSGLESLVKAGGEALDTGTQQTLTGLAETLRRSTRGLDQTGTIRSAKETITSLIDDEWDSHAGGDNNLLLMDANAVAESMTSEKNAAPSSIQFVMRTQEIKVQEEDKPAGPAAAEQDKGTVWSRIKAMFVDLWHSITALFKR